MKKRSLFAAVAMLIVSAIVLTSTTYAWFSLSNNARVQQFSANVESQSGISISVDGGATWHSYLSAADVANAKQMNPKTTGEGASATTTYSWPDAMQAVDYNGNTFYSGVFTNNNNSIYTGTPTANVDYIDFQILVKAPRGNTVHFYAGSNDSTIAASGTGTSVGDVTYADFYFNSLHHYISLGGTTEGSTYTPDSYNAFGSAITSEYPADLVNGIVTNTSIASVSMAGGTTALRDLSFTIPTTGNDYVPVDVRIWVEGQDAQCYGDFVGGDIQCALYFSAEAPAVGG